MTAMPSMPAGWGLAELLSGFASATPASHFLAQALAAELPCGVIGRQGIGFPGEPLTGEPVRNDPADLQGCLAALVARGAGAVAVELPTVGLSWDAAAAVQLSHAIVTDDNPAGLEGDAICNGIVAGMERPDQACVVRQRGLAIRRAIALAGRDDAVLVAGKGHETVQDMGELKVHFTDRAQVMQALGEWRGLGA